MKKRRGNGETVLERAAGSPGSPAELPPPGDEPQAPEAGPAEGALHKDAGSGEEPRGLTGVDVQPLPPPSREDLEALRRERDDLADQLLRRRADFENYRKRVERDRQQASLDASASIFMALLPILDNLERALGSGAQGDPLREGVELIHREMLALLESYGIVAHDPSGQSFDPQIHQALSHEAAPGFEEGMVVEVLQKGYFLKDRLLRPALVKVAKGAEGRGEGGEDAVH